MSNSNAAKAFSKFITSSKTTVMILPLILYYTYKSVQTYKLEARIFKHSLGVAEDNDLFQFFRKFAFSTYSRLTGFYLDVPIQGGVSVNDAIAYIRKQIVETLNNHIIELEMLDVAQIRTELNEKTMHLRVEIYPATMYIMLKNIKELCWSLAIYAVVISYFVFWF